MWIAPRPTCCLTKVPQNVVMKMFMVCRMLLRWQIYLSCSCIFRWLFKCLWFVSWFAAVLCTESKGKDLIAMLMPFCRFQLHPACEKWKIPFWFKSLCTQSVCTFCLSVLMSLVLQEGSTVFASCVPKGDAIWNSKPLNLFAQSKVYHSRNFWCNSMLETGRISAVKTNSFGRGWTHCVSAIRFNELTSVMLELNRPLKSPLGNGVCFCFRFAGFYCHTQPQNQLTIGFWKHRRPAFLDARWPRLFSCQIWTFKESGWIGH